MSKSTGVNQRRRVGARADNNGMDEWGRGQAWTNEMCSDVLLLYIIDEYTLFAIHSVVCGVMLSKWV